MLRGSLALFVLASFVSHAAAQESESWFHRERIQQHYLYEVDDAIARANEQDAAGHLPPVTRAARWSGTEQLSTVFLRFFGNLAPNNSGVERPAPDDHPFEEYEIDLGNHFSYVLMGSANFHILTPTHFYQQLDGANALRYDVLPHEGGHPIRVAVTGSPMYGSLTTVTRHNGVQADEQLPTSVVLGGAAGVDAWLDERVIGVHARVWAMPGADVSTGSFGVSTIESIQVKWHTNATLGGDPTWPVDVGLLAFHLDRGNARSSVYDWTGDFRSASELRDLFQISVFVELHVN